MKQNETVFVGLSGGVDSSVAALILKEEGYNVVGVFIKTWQPDFIECNWERERLDAMRVAAHLDIPFLTCDATEIYKKEVIDYLIKEYSEGRTPNPDIMCNKHVKFGHFLDFSKQHGADRIATGHYVRVHEREGEYVLSRGLDTNKDQSYFLWTLTQEELSQVLFPVGSHTKAEIRHVAQEAGLHTSSKPDSQGICFLGDVDMKQFIKHFIPQESGNVLDESGNIVGSHDGAFLYTIGERHGYQINNETLATHAHYIVSKSMKKNTITIAPNPPEIDPSSINLMHVQCIGSSPLEGELRAQNRYRQEPFDVRIENYTGDRAKIKVLGTIDAPAKGQSCVFYRDTECVGGGIIS